MKKTVPCQGQRTVFIYRISQNLTNFGITPIDHATA